MTTTEIYDCDMKVPDVDGNVAEGPCSDSIVRRGDLLMCTNHAKGISPLVGRISGEVRCQFCMGFRPVGESCGEPCDY